MRALDSFRPAGSLEATPLAPYDGPWNQRLSAHLLRRAGFGGSPSDIVMAASRSMHENVSSLLHFAASDLPSAPVGNIPDPFMVTAPESATPMLFKKLRQEQIDFFIQANEIAGKWWLNRMLNTPAPLQEKMTFFWHGHFTTEMGTKYIRPGEGIGQNTLYRQYALGNIRDLTHAVARDPAMLKYLDNARSKKEHPNENFARELMELFTLGAGHYTERDVRESARAFTGWIVRQNDAGPPQPDGGFFEDPALHDADMKTFLGRSGNFDGDDIIDILFQQPAASRWFARKLLCFFVYDDPEPQLIDALASVIEQNDFELKPTMSVLLRSRVFYSHRAYRALVKSPVEFIIGSHVLCGKRDLMPESLYVLSCLGQTLFHPPGVKGWDGGATWLNSQALLTRENFVGSLLQTLPMRRSASPLTENVPKHPRQAASMLVERILQGDASSADMYSLEMHLAGAGTPEERIRDAAYLTMRLPAYQLN